MSRYDLATNLANLRANAEKRLRRKRKPAACKIEDVAKLQHELQVHQVELELQNLELALARDRLARELEERDAIYQAIGHDFVQPLVASRLYLKALSTTVLDDAQRHMLDRLTMATDAVGELAATISELATPNAARKANVIDCISLGSFLREIMYPHLPLATAKNLQIRCRPSELTVLSDSAILRRIVANLLGNAVKHTQQGGVLVAARRAGNNAVSIEVWDTGPGISPPHLPFIFDDFYQVGNDERNPEKGHGLGLAIARRLARLLGVEVGLRTRVGKGSVFFVRLPIAECSVAAV
jgi:signal transduction histidine kinase